MNLINNTHQIKKIKEHYEIWDIHNRFVCSGDTESEVIDILGELIVHQVKQQYVV